MVRHYERSCRRAKCGTAPHEEITSPWVDIIRDYASVRVMFEPSSAESLKELCRLRPGRCTHVENHMAWLNTENGGGDHRVNGLSRQNACAIVSDKPPLRLAQCGITAILERNLVASELIPAAPLQLQGGRDDPARVGEDAPRGAKNITTFGKSLLDACTVRCHRRKAKCDWQGTAEVT
jgi:hypothetical protein